MFDRRIGDVSGRGKLAADMREIWVMQPRFEKRAGRVPESMVAQLRFRAGFDFMRLRADVGEVDEALASWWQEYSNADENRRYDLMEQAREEQKARTRKQQPVVRRVPRDAAPASTDANASAGAMPLQGGENAHPAHSTALDENGDPAAPKKRRRRRRKPTGGGSEGGEGGEGGASAPLRGSDGGWHPDD